MKTGSAGPMSDPVDRITLRPAAAADEPAIAALHAASWQATYRGTLHDDWLDGPVVADRQALWRGRFETVDPALRLLVAVTPAGTLAGFACCYLDAHPAFGSLLENLHVATAYRGQRLGERLLRESARRIAAERPDTGFHLSVAQPNAPARRFYAALGAAVLEVERWDAPDGSVVMCDVMGWLRVGDVA
jgi:ribosomal protein S18 acetylase RimI-like enzyme